MLAARLGRYISFRINDPELTRRIIVFSLPMIVSALSWWIINSLDKYILSFFCGVSATGLLAVAYKVPTIISTLGATISKAYSVSVLQNFDPTDKDGFLGQSYAVISFSMVLCSSALMLINIPLCYLPKNSMRPGNSYLLCFYRHYLTTCRFPVKTCALH